jgi:hypothetical protein
MLLLVLYTPMSGTLQATMPVHLLSLCETRVQVQLRLHEVLPNNRLSPNVHKCLRWSMLHTSPMYLCIVVSVTTSPQPKSGSPGGGEDLVRLYRAGQTSAPWVLGFCSATKVRSLNLQSLVLQEIWGPESQIGRVLRVALHNRGPINLLQAWPAQLQPSLCEGATDEES